jgi:hypothetical protein
VLARLPGNPLDEPPLVETVARREAAA